MSQVENLLAHVPGVTMSTHGRVLLGHRGVGGDVAVEEIVGECAQQVGYGTRQLVQVREDRLAQVDMRAGRPRVRSGGEQAYPDQAGITMAASARIAREIPVTTATQVGIIAASPQ